MSATPNECEKWKQQLIQLNSDLGNGIVSQSSKRKSEANSEVQRADAIEATQMRITSRLFITVSDLLWV